MNEVNEGNLLYLYMKRAAAFQGVGIRELDSNTVLSLQFRVMDAVKNDNVSCSDAIEASAIEDEVNAYFHCVSEPARPKGIMPRYVWEEKRMNVIREAVNRFADAGQSLNVPEEWLTEYYELYRRGKT